MGFRFRKSIKIVPGLRVNFSTRGSSLSIGGKGATTNISARGVRNTVSLPGTGISYSTYSRFNSAKKSATALSPTAVQVRRLSFSGLVQFAGIAALVVFLVILFTKS